MHLPSPWQHPQAFSRLQNVLVGTVRLQSWGCTGAYSRGVPASACIPRTAMHTTQQLTSRAQLMLRRGHVLPRLTFGGQLGMLPSDPHGQAQPWLSAAATHGPAYHGWYCLCGALRSSVWPEPQSAALCAPTLQPCCRLLPWQGL